MKKHIFLILIFVGLSNCAYWAQIINYTSSEPFVGHRFGALVPGEDTYFYTLAYKRINIAYSFPMFRKYMGNELVKQVPVVYSADADNEIDREFFRFQDLLVLQTESTQFGKHDIFLYTTDLELTQQSNKISAINISLKSSEHLDCTGYTFDQDSTHLIIYALVEDVLNRSFRMYHSIFDQEMNQLESGSQQFIFPSDHTKLHSVHLSKDNHMLAVFQSYLYHPLQFRIRRDNPPTFYLVDLRKPRGNTILLKLEGKEVLDIVVHPLGNQNWLVSGSWIKKSNQESGIFSMTFNSQENVYFNEYLWSYFKTAQVSSIGGQSHKANADEIISTERSRLDNYIVHSFIPTKHGYIMVLEENFVNGVFIRHTRGGSLDNPIYYNNNILVTYFDKAGNLKMTHEIVKNMQQSNRRNATHSFAVFLNKDKLTFLFNDNTMNYNDSRFYNGRNVTTTIRKRNTVLAKVDLDIDLGTSKRTVLATQAESKGFFLPNKSAISADQSHIFVVFHENLANQMYRFGVFRLE